jgi:hypothetical protein
VEVANVAEANAGELLQQLQLREFVLTVLLPMTSVSISSNYTLHTAQTVQCS